MTGTTRYKRSRRKLQDVGKQNGSDKGLQTGIRVLYFDDIIRILHECQVWIDKSVPRVTVWHHEARRVMPDCDPRDRFVYLYLTRLMYSFSCTP